MDDEEKCELILEWAMDHSNFDTAFVEDMLDKLQEGDELTEGQSNALHNIIERFGIE